MQKKVDISKSRKEAEMNLHRYQGELQSNIDYANGIEQLFENRWFNRFIDWIKGEISKDSDNLLLCEDDEVLKIRFEARGKKAILRQLELIKKQGVIAKNKLTELNK